MDERVWIMIFEFITTFTDMTYIRYNMKSSKMISEDCVQKMRSSALSIEEIDSRNEIGIKHWPR